MIVDRDARIVQMVPFDRRAWHAGRSRRGALENLNVHSIGIELVNAGALGRGETGSWVDSKGRTLPDREVVVARRKHEARSRGRHAFTAMQIACALRIARTLHACYRFADVLGHDDIAPDRKIDPGPALPMAAFRFAVLGRRECEQVRAAGEQPNGCR